MFSVVSEPKYNATNEEGRKIVTPKQILQRLPIAFAQVKTGNNSKSLLNEIRQIVHHCIDQKKLIKKCMK